MGSKENGDFKVKNETDYLDEELKTLKFVWKSATDKYIKTYPDFALGIDTVQNSRANNSIVDTKVKINIFTAKLKGLINNKVGFLDVESSRINSIKTKYSDSKLDLDTELSNNNSSKPLKIDKHNENSKSYIYTSYYTIGIVSMSYFIYKQLKQ